MLRALEKALLVALSPALAFLASDAPRSPSVPVFARTGVARTASGLAARIAAPSPRATVAPARLELLTFNAGLAPGAVALARERAANVVQAVRSEPFDILCAQEIWLDDDFQALRTATASRAPHVIRTPKAPVPRASCEPDAVQLLEACHRASCATADASRLAECMVSRCAHLAVSLPSDCVACLVREPWHTIGDARAACAAPAVGAPARAVPGPARSSAVPIISPLAFGGSDGVVVLSRIPFTRTETLRLPSAYSQRVVHFARFDASPVGPLSLFCTHLSAQLGQVAHPGRGTWDDEHAAQVGAMLDWIDARTRGTTGATIVMGDLNAGPALPGRATARRGPQFERVVARGFAAPYVAGADARCTYCNDNPLAGGATGRPGGTLLDHVLVRGFRGHVDATRVFTETRAIRAGVVSKLSDHYGVAAVLLPAGP